MARKKYYCYIIQVDEFAKIGFTSDIHRRMDTLQTGHHGELKLLASYRYRSAQTAKAQETILHSKFAHIRVRGEWFKAPPIRRHLALQKFFRRLIGIGIL